MKKNVSSQSIGAQMITTADGTDFTGTVAVAYTIDNGTQTTGGGTAPVHEGGGYHSYAPLQAETNGDHIAFTFSGTGAITSTVQVYTSFPQTVDNNVLAAGATGFDAIDTVVDAIKVVTDKFAFTVSNQVDANMLTHTAAIPTNYITATGIAASALDGKGDWNIGKTGYSISGTITTLDGLNNFDATIDAVANVTTVGTTTTNTDMRGTDSANTTTPPTTAAIWAEATRTLTAGTNLNDLSFSDIWTGTLTESYATNGAAATPAQLLHMAWSDLRSPQQVTTTWTDFKLDNTTPAMTFTLDDATTPTSKTRAT